MWCDLMINHTVIAASICYVRWGASHCTASQSQKAVTAYLWSKQLLYVSLHAESVRSGCVFSWPGTYWARLAMWHCVMSGDGLIRETTTCHKRSTTTCHKRSTSSLFPGFCQDTSSQFITLLSTAAFCDPYRCIIFEGAVLQFVIVWGCFL